MPTFGERLRQLREVAGLTQEALAAASGVNLWTIRGYEQGRREPNWRQLLDLAGAVGTAAEAFADCTTRGGGRPADELKRAGRTGGRRPPASGQSAGASKPGGRSRRKAK